MRAYAAPDTQALRSWQRRALVRYLAAQPRDFLAVATPGSGKTAFALRIAGELLAEGAVDRITVVVPTEHLKIQWALAAAGVGIALDPKFSNSSAQTSSEYHGVVVTYAQVASHPTRHRVRTENYRTLVVFDEIHHGGDAKSWGEAMREAFGDATRRLALTGTPFRSDDSAIPFVSYQPDGDGLLRSQADHTYGYSEALADGVVRPVVFLAYSGEARWRDSAGEEHAARLGEPLTAEQTARAWRTALNPAGEWMPAVIAAADTRLRQLRQHVPDAGGMIIASDQTAARAYADLLTKITGEAPTRGALRRPGIVGPHQPVLRRHQPLVGRGAHGVRRRRRAPAGRRRVRHERLDTAVLRPGDRPLRPVAAARGDRKHLPAVGAQSSAARQRDGGPAQPRARQAAPRERGRRASTSNGARPNPVNSTTLSNTWVPTPSWIR